MVIVLVVLALIGLLVWALTTYIPMGTGFKNLIYIVAIIFAVIYVLRAFGLWGAVTSSMP
jgi:acid phosphatase family membrane protein YuiD